MEKVPTPATPANTAEIAAQPSDIQAQFQKNLEAAQAKESSKKPAEGMTEAQMYAKNEELKRESEAQQFKYEMLANNARNYSFYGDMLGVSMDTNGDGVYSLDEFAKNMCPPDETNEYSLPKKFDMVKIFKDAKLL